MLKRKVDSKLDKWITGSDKALILSGARQVGKTYSIREALKRNHCNYIEVNLIENPELIPILSDAVSVDDIIVNISAALEYQFIPGETVIFIDEVQELSEIVTRIKFWVDDGRFKYILSGSLLGIEMKNIRSVPVGYVEELEMFPLDFEEFLIASGITGEVISHLKKCFSEKKKVGDLINQKIIKHFYRYLVVGGMPDAVREYVETGDMNAVSEIQRNIILQYKRDFTKYEAENKKLMLESIYDIIPSTLLKQNRRFNYSDIKKGLHFEKTENSFVWLTSAGVIIPVYNATEPRISLAQNKKSSLVKLYSSDVGLLTYQYGNSFRTQILIQNDKINLGGVFENVVAQQMNSNGLTAYFYNSHKNGELDFVIEYNNHIVPIEVKSGKDYYVHSALDKAISNPEYEIEEAYIFANCDISVDGNKNYMPIYMCTFLKDDIELPKLSLDF
ncbi:MAG: ATP-binding protein [Eubacterium sp.]|nr:ATP-binding protein [Eubacterium sp.]